MAIFAAGHPILSYFTVKFSSETTSESLKSQTSWHSYPQMALQVGMPRTICYSPPTYEYSHRSSSPLLTSWLWPHYAACSGTVHAYVGQCSSWGYYHTLCLFTFKQHTNGSRGLIYFSLLIACNCIMCTGNHIQSRGNSLYVQKWPVIGCWTLSISTLCYLLFSSLINYV